MIVANQLLMIQRILGLKLHQLKILSVDLIPISTTNAKDQHENLQPKQAKAKENSTNHCPKSSAN